MSGFNFRILPLTITACGLMMVVKLIAISQGTEHWQEVIAPPAIAEETEPKKAEEKTEEKAEKKKPKKEAKEAKEAEKPAEKPAIEDPKKLAEKCKFNQIEVDLLESLSARREEIEKWAEDVKMQDSVLKATELQIDQKLAQMQKLQGNVQDLLKQYDEKEKVELKSLVKIYESMKPKDAAQIFDEMEMEIMLEVVDLMSERKAASILALMNPIKARDLTVDLAERRRIRKDMDEALPPAGK